MKKESYIKRWQIIFTLALWVPFYIMAQTIQVKGVVTDHIGEPIIGANILEKGTTNGVITDLDGQFTLSVSPKSTLVVSFVGYIQQEIKVNGQSSLKISLKEDNEMLDEVVVVGYGTMKKSDMTGAISSVNTKELTQRTTTNPAEALQGKIAGVNIMKSGGNAGAGVSVKIRGVKSFGDTEPLYIIDGFPGDINNVNPSDISSMEVLKDGAAAAIYGSVAANGVIIITTKNGKKGETKIDFNTYISMTNIANKLEMTNAAQYKAIIKQMYDNYNEYTASPKDYPSYIKEDTGIDTDWQDAMIRNGLSQNYMISVRGGSDKAQYSISYNHSDDKGILLGNNFKQDNARMKVHMTKGIFDIDANLGLRYTNDRQPQYSLKEMYAISPLVPIYDKNEEYGFGLTRGDMPKNNNVMADHHFQKAETKRFRTTGNISLGIKLTSWLNFKSGYSYRGVHSRYKKHIQDYISNPQSPREFPYHGESSYYWQEQVLDNVLNFDKKFGEHSITAMVGSSIQATDYENHAVYVDGKKTVYKVDKNGNIIQTEQPGGFLDPSFDTVAGGDGGTFDGAGTREEYRRASFFGRINYNYNNRYLLQATLRYDGSSKFGKNNRWGCFPSVAVGWRISEEKFFPKNSILNNLKFRASWGRLGNEGALGLYDFQALISNSNNHYGGYVQGSGANAWPGSISWDMTRNDLKWETTDTKNIGFDLGLFDNKLTAAINYYINETNDLLISKQIPPSVAYNTPVLNVGKMRNQGFELELNWSDKVKDFDYSAGFNLSTTKNKVVKLADEGQTLYAAGLVYGTDHVVAHAEQGKPISGFYLYQANGIFQNTDEIKAHCDKNGNLLQPKAKPGDIRFADINGDGKLNEEDKVYSGTGIPKVEMNLNFSAGYKGFDLSFVLSSALGHKLYNGNKYFYQSMKVPTKMLTSVMDAWTPENTHTNIPRAVLEDPNRNSRESTRFLENGNFLRMRQAQIGYTLPKSIMQKMKIDNLRFYISGENLFTITGYDGIDPEFSKNSPLDTGIDTDIYPFTRSFTFGAQLSF